jgi:sulfide dehydrogenase cytochrome subunit
MAHKFAAACDRALLSTKEQHSPQNWRSSVKLPHLTVALCLAVTTGIASAQDPNLARNLAASCANCHNTDGKAVPGAGMVPLAGVDKGRLLQTIKDFKSGTRPATIMHQIAKGYSDEQMELIASYFAAQK